MECFPGDFQEGTPPIKALGGNCPWTLEKGPLSRANGLCHEGHRAVFGHPRPWWKIAPIKRSMIFGTGPDPMSSDLGCCCRIYSCDPRPWTLSEPKRKLCMRPGRIVFPPHRTCWKKGLACPRHVHHQPDNRGPLPFSLALLQKNFQEHCCCTTYALLLVQQYFCLRKLLVVLLLLVWHLYMYVQER